MRLYSVAPTPPQTPKKPSSFDRAKSAVGTKNVRSIKKRVSTIGGDVDLYGVGQRSTSVYCWGRGDNGRLGTGDLYARLEPVVIMHSQCEVKEISCGSLHTILLLLDHRVFSWGEGQHGQLGSSGRAAMASEPQEISDLMGRQVINVSAGGLSSAAVTQDGVLLCWGDNSKGKLGLGLANKSKEKIFEPTQISDPWDPVEKVWVRCHFQRVWIGKRHCAACEKNGGFLTWGENSKGQLGLGDRSSRSYPVFVQGLRNVKEVSLGLGHSAAIDTRSYLYSWGDTGEGRLGHGEKYKEEKSVSADRTLKERRLVDAVLEPLLVEFFRAKRVGISSVACGDRFMVVVDTDGSVWSWGSGVFGQLGLGRDVLMNVDHPSRLNASHFRGEGLTPYLMDSFSPDQSEESCSSDSELSRLWPEFTSAKASPENSMLNVQSDKTASFGRCGPGHTFFYNGQGKTWSWGNGEHAALGTGSQENVFEPVLIPALTGKSVLGLAAGDFHSVAVVREGQDSVSEAGYSLQQISESDSGSVMLAIRPMQHSDTLLRFEPRPGEPKPRNGENELLRNVTGLTSDGNIIVHLGGKSETIIDPQILQTSCATSAANIAKETPRFHGEKLNSIDPVLNMTDREMIEEMEKPNFFTLNPRITDYTPEWKSSWDKYNYGSDSIPYKTGGDQTSPEQSSAMPDIPPTGQPAERRKSFWNSMAFEDGVLHHEHFVALMDKKRFTEIQAHSRSQSTQNNVGVPCSASLGTSRRAPIVLNEGNPGPCDYTPRSIKIGTTVTQERLLKPCGIGLTLTSKRNQRDPTLFDTVVKEVIPGGPVDLFNQHAAVCLTANDVLVEIDGYKMSNIFMARKLIMGNPGQQIHIRYKHKDSRTALSSFAEMTILRSYCPTEAKSGKGNGIEAGFVKTDTCIGLGLTSPRFGGEKKCDILSSEQKQTILMMIEDLRNKDVKDVDLLKSRHCMIPSLVGIRRVIDKIILQYPEWESKVMRPGVILSLFQEEGLMEARSRHEDLGPGTYTPLNTGAHNWSDAGKALSSGIVTLANMHGSVAWRPPYREERTQTSAETEDFEIEMKLSAEMQVFGRHLNDGEAISLTRKDARKLKDAWIKIKRKSKTLETPGPCDYNSSRTVTPKGPTIGVKDNLRDPAFKGSGVPGPGAYDIRRDGLSHSGDFSELRGCGVHIYKEDVSPRRPLSPPPLHLGVASSINSIISGSGNSPANTRFRTSPQVTIQGRYPYEPFLGLMKESGEWQHPSTGPGPNRYSPVNSSSPRAAAMHGREPLEYEKALLLKTRFDPESNRWEAAMPGPCDYSPAVHNDGTQTGPEGAGHRVLFEMASRTSRAADEEQAALPGPGHYNTPSSFGNPSILPRKGTTAVNSGWIGERSVIVPPSEIVPGPGHYSAERFNGIGSDRPCIGASARAKYDMSSTWFARCVKDEVSSKDRMTAVRGLEAAAVAASAATVRPRGHRLSLSSIRRRSDSGPTAFGSPQAPQHPRAHVPVSISWVQKSHPLSARADMRRGVSIGRSPRQLSARERVL